MNINLWLESLKTTGTPDFAEAVQYLGELFPLLHQFAATPQDTRWHAEGDVAIHTQLVLTELYQLLASEAQHITGEQRQALILGAVLHDIGKPLTTQPRERDGDIRIVAPGHEALGRNLIAVPLMSLPLAYSVVQTIMGLAGYHQLPKLLVVRNADYAEYLKLALNADMQLLYWLERADMQGRICDDLPQQLSLLAEFRLFAQEYGVWESDFRQHLLADIQQKDSAAAQRYVDGYALRELVTGDIAMPVEALARTYQRCQHYSQFYLLFGVSGSGKSSWIEQQRRDDWLVISLDEIRADINGQRGNQKNRGQMLQLAKQRLKQALAAGQDVVWDATNIRQDFREPLTSLAVNYGALITMVIFHLDSATLKRQNRNRPYAVSDEVLQQQLAKLQWPLAEESHYQWVIGEHGRQLACNG